ncbi:lon protease homolog 2, peroxisomal-like [Schistocerca cancellata]|uniref:lon protease homolog 2, peroxisomal-like n=1 Tax=Schistocerca cancellata TaxID=274614 RepID=UPI00211797A2|nr:lon protease homolog 2, peroxisomal-like [Schistocerca cancellata]
MTSVITIPSKLPLLVTNDEVLLPGSSKKFTITDPSNIEMIRSRIMSRSSLASLILGVLPKELAADLQGSVPLHPVGTAALVVQVVGTSWRHSASFTLLLYGICRFRLEKLVMEVPYPVGVVSQLDKLVVHDDDDDSPEVNAMLENLRELATKLTDFLNVPPEVAAQLKDKLSSLPSHTLVDLCASVVDASFPEKLKVLDAVNLADRLKITLPLLIRHTKELELTRSPRTKTSILPINNGNTRRGMRVVIPRGRAGMNGISRNDIDNDDEDEIQELYRKLDEANLPQHARKVAVKELQRLSKMSPMSPETGIIMRYVELMVDLPWSKSSVETLDLNKARQDLDADHYGLARLKRRVLEHLAVRQLRDGLRGPLLCFVGPPGVGKTSVGRSIAHSLGRSFHRISLGGVSNQSDIRGHRRTYIGAMPGRIIQGLKNVGVNNPVFLLDEVDKLGTSAVNGDPAAALLEVLDPEQNCTFVDHYLNVPFDLSKVMFIATANTTKTIPPALLDRMEVIHIPGYTQEEKLHIATRHLFPKQLELHGLTKEHLQIPDESFKLMISDYTREAGVRTLERKIGALCRAVAVMVVESKNSTKPLKLPVVLTEASVEEILGPAVYSGPELWSRLGQAGVALGLAWTEAGGELLLVEASQMAGSGDLMLTGQLGSVMRESAQLALNWVRGAAKQYGLKLDGETLSHLDIHIHFPAGAVGKDGPSAGVTIATALISLFSNKPTATDIAMTGEITLRGVVLPVGGVKDKVLAAHRAGVKRVILPKKCEKDLHEVPENVKKDLTFVFVNHMDEVLQAAFDSGFPPGSLKMEVPMLSKL